MTLKLPLHSIVAFLVGTLLAEDYNLFPSFLLFGIAWVLLGTMEYQNSHPSPWRKKRTYLEHLQVLVFNRQFTDTIDSYENNDEIEKYKEEEARRKLKHEEEATKEAMRAQRDAKEQKAEEEVAIVPEKQRFGISLNIMQPILSPVQQNLGGTIVHLRIAKSFVTWEQSRGQFLACQYSFCKRPDKRRAERGGEGTSACAISAACGGKAITTDQERGCIEA